MKSLQIIAPDSLSINQTETPSSDDWKKIKVIAAGLNRRDYWITKGLYPGIQYPCTLGSDAVGILDDQRVIINPGLGWEQPSRVQPNDFSILGLPKAGTFAEFVSVPEQNIYLCPNHLTDDEASVLGLAGLTAYRALFSRANLTPSDKVLVSGVGGGVATIALQFALANGCETYVTSSSEEKITKALELGALGGYRYDTKEFVEVAKEEAGGFDVIIDSAAGPSFSSLVDLCNPGGRIVFYGGTKGDFADLPSRKLFWNQISILGSTMGSNAEFAEMLYFVNHHKIHPVVDTVYDFNDYESAFKRLSDSSQFGKLSLRIQAS